MTISDPLDLRWRVGQPVGRTIYAVVGAEPSDDDVLIGMMDTAELAGEACTAHNVRWEGVVGTIPTGSPNETNRPLTLLLAEDGARWPLGHPCRDCGALQYEHPNDRAGCESWR